MDPIDIPSLKHDPVSCDAVVHLQWTLAMDWRTISGGSELLPGWKSRATSWRDGQDGTDLWVESLDASQTPSWKALQRAQVAAGLNPEFRRGPATSGERHYGWYQDLERRMVRKFDVDGQNDVPPLARALRGFLDIIHTHPFEDGNTRAACAWLVWSMAGAGVDVPELGPFLALPKPPASNDALDQMIDLLAPA